MTIDDYKVILRIGRSNGTGCYEINRLGNRKEKTKYNEYYKTKLGEFKVDEWNRQVKEIIMQQNEWHITIAIIEYIKKNCFWLHENTEIEEHALFIHTSRIYEKWEKFELPQNISVL